LIKNIGGASTDIYDKIKFGNPISLRLGQNDKVYILDKKDKGYKIYDKDLNWIHTAVKKTDFQSTTGSVVDMAVDKTTEYAYILTDNGIIFEYDNDSQLVNKHTLQDVLEENEKFIRITFSKTDTNIMYILTTKNLYKKFRTKLTKSIGAFRLLENDINGERLTFVSTYNAPGSIYDYVFVGGETIPFTGYTLKAKSDIGKIFKFNERVYYQTIIYDDYKTHVYPMSSINIQGDEFVTSWVFNKAVYKLIYNHLLLRDNLHSGYVGEYDTVGRPQYKGVNYHTDSSKDIYRYNTTLNNFIGINEPVLAETVNRPLNEIYKVQKELLELCREKYTNKFPYASQVVAVT
jgi:hypothetical protein